MTTYAYHFEYVTSKDSSEISIFDSNKISSTRLWLLLETINISWSNGILDKKRFFFIPISNFMVDSTKICWYPSSIQRPYVIFHDEWYE